MNLLFKVLALVCFLLETFDAPVPVNLIALGLALYVLGEVLGPFVVKREA